MIDAAEAISRVMERIEAGGLDYPTTRDLLAEAYANGWCVYAPSVLEVENPMAVSDQPRPSVFLVDGWSGEVDEVEDANTETVAEACLWRGTSAPRAQDRGASDLPPFPRIWGPRRGTDHDRQAIDALASGLARERDFAGWLASRLAELADLLGDGDSLLAGGSDRYLGEHVKALVDARLEDEDGPREAWRTWPAKDPAELPEADTAGWLLTAIEPAATWLDGTDLETQTPQMSELAATLFNEFRRVPRWRACGIVEYYPQLFSLHLRAGSTPEPDEPQPQARERWDHDAQVRALGAAVLTPSPDDPDVEVLLRLAIDAEHRDQEYIDLDAAASAAYRRVLDRFGLPLEFGENQM